MTYYNIKQLVISRIDKKKISFVVLLTDILWFVLAMFLLCDVWQRRNPSIPHEILVHRIPLQNCRKIYFWNVGNRSRRNWAPKISCWTWSENRMLFTPVFFVVSFLQNLHRNFRCKVFSKTAIPKISVAYRSFVSGMAATGHNQFLSLGGCLSVTSWPAASSPKV